MQSLSIPRPPIQFSTDNLNTIERINSLVENLDLKLAQLCSLNFAKSNDICSNNCTKDLSLSENVLLQLKTKTNDKILTQPGKISKDLGCERSVENHQNQFVKDKCSVLEENLIYGNEIKSFQVNPIKELGSSKNLRKGFKSTKLANFKETNSILSKSDLNLSTHLLPKYRKRSESDTRIVETSVDVNFKKAPGLNGYLNHSDQSAVGQTVHALTEVKENNNSITDISSSYSKTDGLSTIREAISQSGYEFDKNTIQATLFEGTNQTTDTDPSSCPKVAKHLLSKEESRNLEYSRAFENNSVIPNCVIEKPNSIRTITAKQHKAYTTRNPQGISFNLSTSAKVNVMSCSQPVQQPKKSAVVTQEAGGVAQLKTLSNNYRAKVIDAYRNRQIFTVFGNYNTIRRSLLKRGWLEKLPSTRYTKLQNLPEEVLLQHAKRGNEYEAVAISKIINHFPAFFVWQPKGQRDLYTDVQPYRNRIRRTQMLDFSTKVGLIGCAEQQLWYLQVGVAGMLYPRFYRLGGNQEEQTAFMEDFRITQCRSLLQHLIMNIEMPGDVLDYETGVVSPVVIHFALGRVRRQLDDWDNVASLDTEPTQIPDTEWNDFMANSSKVINLNHKFKCTYREMEEFVKTARLLLSRIVEKRPDFKWDGSKNLWILKPGYQSRGLGIIIRNNLDDILRWSSSHSNRRYIVQKYIEQPLLIYRTKFDIRQYMLVFIRESTVQIWLYRDCYLRFSSQEYSIDDLREVVHLTNNSVQKKYKIKATRDPRLPKNNMWSLDQFKAYLKSQQSENVWETRVFAGFRENLIAVVMASLDETNLCENSFELYGCDFMLDQQFNPILIEINSSPDMSASTEVTAHICPLVMQDCIKVIVDLPRNSRAMTGQFKLVYEVNYKFKQDANSKDNLNISGKSVELCRRKQLPPVRPKFFKKANKNELVVNRQSSEGNEESKKLIPSVQHKKSKTLPSTNMGQSLKAATKEVLALRYTMPK